MQTSVFFAPEGAKGLNETSATKLAAIASNLKTKEEAVLRNMSFLNVQVAIVGSGEKLDYGTGMTEQTLKAIPSLCHRIGQLNGFISWVSEARKAVEAERVRIRRVRFEDWAKESGIEMPVSPELPDHASLVDINWAIDQLNIKERAEYLALEAKASQIGKIIHPDGTMDDARNELHTRINAKQRADGKGRDMLVYSYTPSVSANEVDQTFEELQRQYQNYESSLNHIKSDLRKKVDQYNSATNADYRNRLAAYNKAYAEYDTQYRELIVRFNQWQQDETTAAAKLKIAIPECYEELLKELYNVGK